MAEILAAFAILAVVLLSIAAEIDRYDRARREHERRMFREKLGLEDGDE